MDTYTAELDSYTNKWWVLSEGVDIVADELEEDEARELAETLNDAVYGDYGD